MCYKIHFHNYITFSNDKFEQQYICTILSAISSHKCKNLYTQHSKINEHIKTIYIIKIHLKVYKAISDSQQIILVICAALCNAYSTKQPNLHFF